MRLTKARYWYCVLTVIVSVALLATACGLPSSSAVLLVQNAERATFTGNDAGAGRLTLEGVDARILYFGNRPNRAVGSVPVQDALDALFASDSKVGPPNAALSWIDGGSEHTTVFVLESGVYDAEASTVTYEIRPLSEETQDSFGGEIVDLPSGSVGPASLFIDSADVSHMIEKLYFNPHEFE